QRCVYVTQWQRAALESEDDEKITEHTGDGGSLYRLSLRVLLAHEDKNFQGALIASLSTPWGETKTDEDAGGYHLVWTRDLVQSVSVGGRGGHRHADAGAALVDLHSET